MFRSSIRTRLALLMAGLAALTALAVGALGYQLTAGRFNREIQSSLGRFAAPLEDADGVSAQRTCSTGSFVPSAPASSSSAPCPSITTVTS